jgi:hypothetical protein
MPWFMAQIRRGFFELVNPYSHKRTAISAAPGDVHSLVFWSKNYDSFIAGGYGERLQDMGYHLYFHFTINSAKRWLEPQLPPLARRLVQLKRLCRDYGPACVNWRFDPICLWRRPDGHPEDNLNDVALIADGVRQSGLDRCTTSFLDPYAKIERRMQQRPGWHFVDPPLSKKVEILLEMERLLDGHGIRLETCCEAEVLQVLPAGSSIRAGACIPNDRLMALFGGNLSQALDRGQRTSQGCRCQLSRDIGSYRQHPCYHNCLFCYANPRPPGPSPAWATFEKRRPCA